MAKAGGWRSHVAPGLSQVNTVSLLFVALLDLGEDQLLGYAEVIGALAKVCALPRDMETHERFDDESLMVSAIQANLLKGEVWARNKKTAELESELARLKAESTAEGTRLRGEVLAGRAETARLKTANADLEKEKAALQAEAQSAFQDGVDRATEVERVKRSS